MRFRTAKLRRADGDQTHHLRHVHDMIYNTSNISKLACGMRMCDPLAAPWLEPHFPTHVQGLAGAVPPDTQSEMLRPNRGHLPKATRSNTVVTPW
jgi:hypothetical protein